MPLRKARKSAAGASGLDALLKPGKPLLPSSRNRERSSDVVTAALGITLCLVCALFPWYIFFNQEKFGVRAMQFEGQTTALGTPMRVTPIIPRDGLPLPGIELDLFTTATTDEDLDDRPEPPGVEAQPFPLPPVTFKLVHVANGRAMIEDDAGVFIVQHGSRLPDNSRVARFERRGADWVIVTSDDRVIGMQR